MEVNDILFSRVKVMDVMNIANALTRDSISNFKTRKEKEKALNGLIYINKAMEDIIRAYPNLS
tara:strand:+ start:1182 stop:1370 length:189 start_codon:yes stop_codon:yes gene_type:complete